MEIYKLLTTYVKALIIYNIMVEIPKTVPEGSGYKKKLQYSIKARSKMIILIGETDA